MKLHAKFLQQKVKKIPNSGDLRYYLKLYLTSIAPSITPFHQKEMLI
jgi:hypothetical protein